MCSMIQNVNRSPILEQIRSTYNYVCGPHNHGSLLGKFSCAVGGAQNSPSDRQNPVENDTL